MLLTPNIGISRQPEPGDDIYYFRGSHRRRAIEALQIAHHQARLIEIGPRDRWLDDAKGPIEDGIATLLSKLRQAIAEDEAEAAARNGWRLYRGL